MSIFICCECDSYGDCDNGCEECKTHKFGLICSGCIERMEEEKEEDNHANN
jgi:hypothetical protein